MLWAWRERMRDLKRDFRLKSFVIVKNHGAAAGATLDHPHSQLLALPFVPQHLERRAGGGDAASTSGRRAACSATDRARKTAIDRRVIATDDARRSRSRRSRRACRSRPGCCRARTRRRSRTRPTRCCSRSRRGCSDVLRRLDVDAADRRRSHLVLHTAPVGEDARASYHWHLEIIPRLAPVTGLEWDGGVYVNPVPPEEAARGAARTRCRPSR